MKQLLLTSSLLTLSAFSQADIIFDIGLSGGGEEMIVVEYTDGSSSSHSLNDDFIFGLGYEHRITPLFSLKAMSSFKYGYMTLNKVNVDFTASSSAIPLELVAYMHPHNNFNIGAGINYDAAVSYTETYENVSDEFQFDSNLGWLIAARGYLRFSDIDPNEQGGVYMEAKYSSSTYTLNSVNGYEVSNEIAEAFDLDNFNGNRFTLTFGLFI